MTEFDELRRRAWAGRAEPYAETMGRLCAHAIEALLDAAQVAAGTRVLDVGTGPGTVAAVALARGAHVVAIDPSPDMRALAQRNAPGAEVHDGALPHLRYADATFDAVVANFVLNQVGDPRLAVVELARVCRPGGRVAVSIWPRPASPVHRLWEDVIEASGARLPATLATLPPERDFERTEAGLAGLLADAGLHDVAAVTVAFTHRVDPELWWSGPARGVASIGTVFAGQTAEVAASMRAHYDRLSAPYLADGRLHLPACAVVGSGTVVGSGGATSGVGGG